MHSMTNIANLTKEQRYHAIQEQRKLKREDMLMKRRGLNFVTEHHEELLDQSTITACEQQLDNVAPKVVALLGLGEDCDTQAVRSALVHHCIEYGESLKGKNNRRDAEEVMNEDDT